MKLQVGDLINVKRGDDFIGNTISYMTDSIYVHTMCYIGDGRAIESNWGGVKILSNFGLWDGCDVFRHKTATKEQLQDAVNFMISKDGAGYDYLGLLGIGIAITIDSTENIFDMKNRFWCSELAIDGFHVADIETGLDKTTRNTSPGDIARSNYFEKVN